MPKKNIQISERKFYKKTMKVEFLSEEPFPNMSLEGMVCEATTGEFSMNITQDTEMELDGKQAARALLNHGSDPSFFQLTAKGEELNEDNDF